MSYLTSPRQARTIADLLEQALYPVIWPDGSMRDTDDIVSWTTPYARLDLVGPGGTIELKITAGNGQRVSVYVNEAGRALQWHEEQQAYEPACLRWWVDPRWPSALWKLHVEFDEPDWYDGRGSMTHCTYPGADDTRTAVIWNHGTADLLRDECQVRDMITGEIHVVHTHDVGIGVGDEPCGGCGSFASLNMVVEYAIECPAHSTPFDSQVSS